MKGLGLSYLKYNQTFGSQDFLKNRKKVSVHPSIYTGLGLGLSDVPIISPKFVFHKIATKSIHDASLPNIFMKMCRIFTTQLQE